MRAQQPAAPPHTGLAHRVAIGTAWGIALRWGIRAIGLLSTIVFARFLQPGDFGLAAIAMVFVGFIEMFKETGQNLAIIRHPCPTSEHYDSAWTIQVIVGFAVSGAILLSAHAGTLLLHDARVEDVIRVISLRPLIGGFENIGIVDFRRNFRFHMEFKYLIARRTATLLTTFVAISITRNYWGLVIGLVGDQVVGVGLSYVFSPMRPRFSLSRIPELASFSIWTLVGYLGRMLNERTDELVIGNLGGATALGLYNVASDIGASAVLEIVNPLSRTAYSAYARLAHDHERLKLAFLEVLSTVATISFFATAVSWLVSQDLVLVLLGGKWLSAAPLLGWLAAAGGLLGFITTVVNFLNAAGEARFAASLLWVRAGFLVPILWLVGWYDGAASVPVARTFVLLASAMPMLLAVNRVFRLTPTDIIRQIWRPAVSAGVVLATIPVCHPYLPEFPVFRLSIELTIAAFLSVTSLLSLWVMAQCPGGFERRLVGLVIPYKAAFFQSRLTQN